MLVRTLAEALGLNFSRIQFTPDLMPADIIGTTVIEETSGGKHAFEFRKGPVFANIVLADEINRATPKTQSALLEAMQEHRVTVGRTTYTIEEPYFVLATQNPLEMEGTYPLPEAQLDRFFFKLHVPFPGREELHSILDRTTTEYNAKLEPVISAEEILAMQALVRTVPVARHVQDYAVRLLQATHPDGPDAPEKCAASCASARRRAARSRCSSPRRSARCSRDASPRASTTCERRPRRRFATAFSSTSRARPKASKPTIASRKSWTSFPRRRRSSELGMGVLDVFKRAAAPVSRRLGRPRIEKADLFDDEFQRKLETLAIVSRRVFAGRMRAERRTKKKGSGIEFADHRDYAAGDDFRYVDWNVYQRFGRLLVRLYEEEEDLSIYFIVDCSTSMGFGDGKKFDQARRLAAALAYVGLANLDRVTIVASDATRSSLACRRRAARGASSRCSSSCATFRPTARRTCATASRPSSRSTSAAVSRS